MCRDGRGGKTDKDAQEGGRRVGGRGATEGDVEASEEADYEEVACACDLGKHGVIAWMRVRMTIKNIRKLSCHVSYSEL